MAEYILKDLSRNDDGTMANGLIDKSITNDKWMGHAAFFPPPDQHTVMDFTGNPGSCTGLLYGLMFQLRKWHFKVEKASETIEVSPVHQQYYQLTVKQKEELENKIKQGLTSAAQTVADLELLEHDMRKYQEFIDYFGLAYDPNTRKLVDANSLLKDDKIKKAVSACLKDKSLIQEKADELTSQGRYIGYSVLNNIVKHGGKVERDEHSLKAIFVDQVDFHVGSTGQGAGRLSMSFMQQNNIMPTIVQDFFDMNSEDDLEKNPRIKNIPTVEKNMLKAKWRAYQEWKRLFGNEVKTRYIRLKGLTSSREKSLEEYRNWLKPYIARHKILEEGLDTAKGRKEARTLFVDLKANATSFNNVELWTWKDFITPEVKGIPGESIALQREDGLRAYDDWTQKNIIFHPEYGLQKSYPWVTKKWVDEQAKEIEKGLNPHRLYYTFFLLKMDRTNFKMASGEEYEDADFTVSANFMSQNVLLAKLLDLKCRQEEVERHVNELLGLSHMKKGEMQVDELKVGKFRKMHGGVEKALGISMRLFRKAPYDAVMNDRVAKYYLKAMGSGRFGPFMKLIHEKVGFGQ